MFCPPSLFSAGTAAQRKPERTFRWPKIALFCSKAGHKTVPPSESRLDLTVLQSYEPIRAIMGPNELDEFQGFSVGILHAWLVKQGWKDVTPPRQAELGSCVLTKGSRQLWIPRPGGSADPAINGVVGWWWLFLVAEAVKLSVQELLRQVNPRLRCGWPSDDDLKTYDRWLVRCRPLGDMMGVWESATMREHKEEHTNVFVECWPVDAVGNKVRWN